MGVTIIQIALSNKLPVEFLPEDQREESCMMEDDMRRGKARTSRGRGAHPRRLTSPLAVGDEKRQYLLVRSVNRCHIIVTFYFELGGCFTPVVP